MNLSMDNFRRALQLERVTLYGKCKFCEIGSDIYASKSYSNEEIRCYRCWRELLQKGLPKNLVKKEERKQEVRANPFQRNTILSSGFDPMGGNPFGAKSAWNQAQQNITRLHSNPFSKRHYDSAKQPQKESKEQDFRYHDEGDSDSEEEKFFEYEKEDSKPKMFEIIEIKQEVKQGVIKEDVKQNEPSPFMNLSSEEEEEVDCTPSRPQRAPAHAYEDKQFTILQKLLLCQIGLGPMKIHDNLMGNSCSKTWCADGIKRAVNSTRGCPNCRCPLSVNKLKRNITLSELVKSYEEIKDTVVKQKGVEHNKGCEFYCVECADNGCSMGLLENTHVQHQLGKIEVILEDQVNKAEETISLHNTQILTLENTKESIKNLKTSYMKDIYEIRNSIVEEIDAIVTQYKDKIDQSIDPLLQEIENKQSQLEEEIVSLKKYVTSQSHIDLPELFELNQKIDYGQEKSQFYGFSKSQQLPNNLSVKTISIPNKILIEGINEDNSDDIGVKIQDNSNLFYLNFLKPEEVEFYECLVTTNRFGLDCFLLDIQVSNNEFYLEYQLPKDDFKDLDCYKSSLGFYNLDKLLDNPDDTTTLMLSILKKDNSYVQLQEEFSKNLDGIPEIIERKLKEFKQKMSAQWSSKRQNDKFQFR